MLPVGFFAVDVLAAAFGFAFVFVVDFTLAFVVPLGFAVVLTAAFVEDFPAGFGGAFTVVLAEVLIVVFVAGLTVVFDAVFDTRFAGAFFTGFAAFSGFTAVLGFAFSTANFAAATVFFFSVIFGSTGFLASGSAADRVLGATVGLAGAFRAGTAVPEAVLRGAALGFSTLFSDFGFTAGFFSPGVATLRVRGVGFSSTAIFFDSEALRSRTGFPPNGSSS